MSVIGNPLLLGGDAGAPSFTTQRSVRLRSSASPYFMRSTFPVSATGTKFTMSFWMKLGTVSPTGNILAYVQTTGNGYQAGIGFANQANGQLSWWMYNGTNLYLMQKVPAMYFRDPTAWYHIVCIYDSTNTTAEDRAQIWINGVRVTTWAINTSPALNAISYFSSGSASPFAPWLGAENRNNTGIANPFDGYLAEVHIIDGQAVSASAFGEYDAVRNTQWKPKRYAGTYGTNGSYLQFSDNSGQTTAGVNTGIGKDFSGNGNMWLSNNISLTAGVTYDSMTDVPTLTSETASNFCTLNPLVTTVLGQARPTISDGNLNISFGNAGFGVQGSQFASAGKLYFEVSGTNVGGIYNTISAIGFLNDAGLNWNYQVYNGAISTSSGSTSAYSGTGYGSGAWPVIGCAVDLATGKIWWRNNSGWFGSGDPSTGANPAFSNVSGNITPFWNGGGGGYSGSHYFNFGQRPFAYTPPAGFNGINTYNLPDPAIASSDDYHKVYTYTGNGGGLQVGEIQKPASLFNLDRSLRFRAAGSAYFNRTAGTPTNANIWTLSGWIKRGALATRSTVLCGGTNNVNYVCFNDTATNDYFGLTYANTPSQLVNVMTNQSFKDPAAWNHFMVVYDSTSATNTITGTSTDRVRLYINGVQVTSFSATTPPAINTSVNINAAASILNLGRRNNTTPDSYFDGYLADVYFIDGQALDPTSFGQYDGNYYWTPKAYSGTYGTNGWHLEFEDFSAATAAAIGKDTSGQGNNWTPNNINLTTPANTNSSWDSMVDVPTSTSADVANYCTLNPLRSFVSGSAATFTNGNLNVSIPAVLNPPRNVTSTYDVFSGKWYWEVIAGTVASNFVIGIASKAMDFNATIFTTGSYLYDATTGNKNIGGTASAYGATYTTNDVIGIALDMDAGTLTFYKNGVSQGVAVTGLQGLTVTPVIAASGSSAITGTFNFGQRPFRYSNYGTDRPDATFKPINSFNIAEVTGDLESPDFVWIKSRSAGTEHALFNSVVGTGKYLRSSNTAIEVTDVNSLIQFNKNGFLLGNAAIVNASAATFVASAWKTGGSVVTNNAGSIASQVRANPSAGISVVTYTGNGTNGATVGHGLGVAPKVVLYKTRSNSNDGCAFHASLGGTQRLIFFSTSSGNLLASTDSTFFNNTAPSSSVLTLGTRSHVNDSSGTWTYVAYCFAEIAGFSKFTSYAANGSSTDGPFVACGFAPRWIMIKRATGASGTGGWIMYDTSRSTYNTMSEYLFAEGAAGGNTLAAIDVTANGFKIKTNNVHLNQTANDIYVVMAFAEHPFKYSLAR